MTTFTYNNIDYTVTDNGYYYKTVNGKKTRISLKAFEAARNAAIAESEAKMDEAMDRKVEEAQSKKEAMERSMNRMEGEVDTITQEDLDNAAEDPTVTLEQFTDMLAEAELAQTIAEYEESFIEEEKAEILIDMKGKEELDEAMKSLGYYPIDSAWNDIRYATPQHEVMAWDTVKEGMDWAKDRMTEATFNGTAKEETPKEAKPKKARKPRRSKDSKEFEVDGQKISLTPKQIDFIQHLPDTCFWDNGLDSCIWVDCLCDDIGGQFADKPMTVGAMISTLCEKGLGDRIAERRDGKKCTSFELTETGKAIAEMLGVH